MEVIVDHPRFTIYGEIHNMIENNSKFKKAMDLFDKNEIVMCEHTTYKPFLDLEKQIFVNEGFSQLLKKMKGSEWVYLKRLSQEKPVECVDIRVDNGFPMAIEEKLFEKNGLNDLLFFVSHVKKIIGNVNHHKEFYTKHPVSKQMYKNITKGITERFKKITDIGDDKKDDKTEDFDILCKKLNRIAGLLVDVYIFNRIESILKEKEDSHISIFVGARHALVLYEMLKLEYGDDITISKSDLITQINLDIDL